MSKGDCSLVDSPGGVWYVHITFLNSQGRCGTKTLKCSIY